MARKALLGEVWKLWMSSLSCRRRCSLWKEKNRLNEVTTDARYNWLRLHSPQLAVFFSHTFNRTTSLLTGTMSDAHPTPTPEKNRPAWSKPGTFPKPIMSQPTENGRVVSMRAILRPKKSIIHPPRGPPNMAPILRRDWGEKQTNRINEWWIYEVHS